MQKTPLRLVVFRSRLGWIALVHRGNVILKTSCGHRHRGSALRAVAEYEVQPATPDARETRWIERITAYADGRRVSLNQLRIDQSWMTPFQQRVIDLCRAIGRGETVTYGQLAVLAGSPGASRAVGSTMAKNRFPLIVPCHRVVGCNGIGGFSGPDGVKLKRRLLANEGVQFN